MTTQKRGFYFYVVALGAAIGFIPFLFAPMILKEMWAAGVLFSDYGNSVRAIVSIIGELWLIGEALKHYVGYTLTTTTQYQLFKCRESGKEENFMMFADTEEELTRFFDIMHPDKKFFIESAEMTGKSINMKIFNNEN